MARLSRAEPTTTSTCCASPATSRRRKDDVRLQRIHDEVERGFDALRDIEDGVSVFGSARVQEGHRWYELCRETVGLPRQERLHGDHRRRARV